MSVSAAVVAAAAAVRRSGVYGGFYPPRTAASAPVRRRTDGRASDPFTVVLRHRSPQSADRPDGRNVNIDCNNCTFHLFMMTAAERTHGAESRCAESVSMPEFRPPDFVLHHCTAPGDSFFSRWIEVEDRIDALSE